MKARSKQAIESSARDVNRARGKEYPKDNGYIFAPYSRCNPTWWCVPCRKSFKHGPSGNGEFGHCPICCGPLESSHRRPVPWSKKGRKWARRAKYKGGK